MIKPFNVGDKVVAIDFRGQSGSYLKRGTVYEVRSPEYKDACLRLVGIDHGFFSDRFELANPEPSKASTTILGTQVGGSHYTDCAIQPIEYIWANKLGFSEGNIIKYVSRWRSKGGVKDLEKAKHHIALLIERTLADEAAK